MDWMKILASQSLKLMSDPRVAKLMQDERFLKLMMAAMSAPAKVQSFTTEGKDTLLDTLGLATREEVDDLRRTVRSLEEQLGALQEVLSALVGDHVQEEEEEEGAAGEPGASGGKGRWRGEQAEEGDDDELDDLDEDSADDKTG